MEAEYKTVVKNDENIIKWRYFVRQLFVCTTATMFYFMIGISLGAPTVAVPQLRREANSTSAVSEDMASWITSIVPYSAIFWLVIIIIVAHHIGRKRPMMVIALNSLCAFVILYLSKNIQYIFYGQLLQGLTQASFTTTSSMVVLEYTSPEYRGLFIAIFSATYFWGIWVANAIGTFFNYRNIGLVGIVSSIYTFITLVFMPESPYWLACNARYDECAKVHRWLKGIDEEAEKELNALINSQKDAKIAKIKTKNTFVDYINNYMNVLQKPQVYKPIFTCLIVMASYNFSGKLVCAVYAVEIMKKITKTESDAYIGVLILDAFSVAGMYMGSFLARYLKRRTLLMGASVICIISLLALSVYLYLVSWSVLLENGYISIIMLAVFSLAACCGPMIVCSALFAELYPIRHRSFTMCIMCITSKICLGTSLKVAPYIFKVFRIQGSFLFFAVCMSITMIFVYKYIPETKDKTMQEISEMFRKNKIEDAKESEPLQSSAV